MEDTDNQGAGKQDSSESQELWSAILQGLLCQRQPGEGSNEEDKENQNETPKSAAAQQPYITAVGQ